MNKKRMAIFLAIILFSMLSTQVIADVIYSYQAYLPIVVKPENTPTPTPIPPDYQILDADCAFILVDPVYSIFVIECTGHVRNNTNTSANLIVSRILYNPYDFTPYEYWNYVDIRPLGAGKTSTFTLRYPFGDYNYGVLTARKYP